MTKLDIFNMALAQHGKRCTQAEIESSNPPTEVEACERMYRTAVDNVLGEYDWSFCVVPIELYLDDDEPYGKWTHGFRMPGNVIRIARPYSGSREPFFITGGRYYTDEDRPEPWGILYSSKIMDVAPPDFCDLVGIWLGYLISTLISPGDVNLANRILQNYSAGLSSMMKREQNSLYDNYLDADDWSMRQR